MRRAAHPREELAALALGALEGDEAAAVRAHVEGCDACRAELRGFEALPALLDLADLQAEPVPPPPTALEGAVLAQIDSERRAAPRPAAPQRRRRLALPGPVWGLAGAALAVGVLAVAGLLGGGEAGPAGERVVALHGPAGTARATLTPESSGTRVDLRVSDVPASRGEQVYELWFSRGRDRVSAGTFRVGADGSATAHLTTAVPEREAQRLWVTREPNGDDPRPNGPTVLRAKLVPA